MGGANLMGLMRNNCLILVRQILVVSQPRVVTR